ncbi:alpha/beta hydrolase [Nonomuraea sp. NPDC050663]|uniref:alpha/beta hydrolase n=1 Tax=Nonomuraea sp. NPDC050663 TaxID=3364370 RepID=UPI0037A846F6
MPDVRIIVGPDVVADAALLQEVAERECAALDVTLGREGEAVVVVSSDPDLAGQFPGAVWLDLARNDHGPDIHGRGVAGLTWAVRRAVHRRRHPGEIVAYGTHPDQWAELHLPPGPGPHPVVALVHGGYWRSIWGADLMDALCVDLCERGFAAWNLEYRRPDLHGWEATAADVTDGLRRLATLEAPLDLGKVAVAGHSAGGQLALRAAADLAADEKPGNGPGLSAALAVSLAGVLDLVEGDRRWLSSGAVRSALGAVGPAGPGLAPGLTQRPTGVEPMTGAEPSLYESELFNSVYGDASPLHRLPLGVRQLIVQGRSDDLDLVDFARRYARAAKEAGDDVTYLEMSGDHFAVINPKAPIWQTTALAIANALR